MSSFCTACSKLHCWKMCYVKLYRQKISYVKLMAGIISMFTGSVSVAMNWLWLLSKVNHSIDLVYCNKLT